MKKEKPVPLQELQMRDFFAAFSLLSLLGIVDGDYETEAIELTTKLAYQYADSMMEERKK